MKATCQNRPVEGVLQMALMSRELVERALDQRGVRKQAAKPRHRGRRKVGNIDPDLQGRRMRHDRAVGRVRGLGLQRRHDRARVIEIALLAGLDVQVQRRQSLRRPEPDPSVGAGSIGELGREPGPGVGGRRVGLECARRVEQAVAQNRVAPMGMLLPSSAPPCAAIRARSCLIRSEFMFVPASRRRVVRARGRPRYNRD